MLNRFSFVTSSLLVVVFVCIAAQQSGARSWPQEPKTFRKVSFNASTAELVATLPSLSCRIAGVDSSSMNCTDTFSIGHVTCTAYYRTAKNKFVWVHGLFATEDFEVMKAVFVDKFGEPHTTASEVVTTLAGRDRVNTILTWTGETVIVILNKCESGLEKGGFSFKLKSYLEERISERKQERKKAVDDF